MLVVVSILFGLPSDDNKFYLKILLEAWLGFNQCVDRILIKQGGFILGRMSLICHLTRFEFFGTNHIFSFIIKIQSVCR